MSTFTLPDLGEGLQDAEIVAWNVAVGDHVVADQPMLSVETDKAVVEIPAPESGQVLALHAAVGDVVPTGAPLLELDSGARARDAGTVVGALPTAGPGPGAMSAARGRPQPRDAGVRAAPAVRSLAARLQVDLSRVRGSGPAGTVTRADVEDAAASAGALAAREPLRGVRRAMARNMAQAHAQVVPATLTEVADIHRWAAGTDITLRLVRALCAACAEEPALNAWFLGPEDGRRLNRRVDLGIAMDTPQGLFVPVLRDAANRDAAELRSGLERMKADVRARSVPREELRGATITLSNFGMFAGLHAALVVLPPQVAIVGVGRAHERAVPDRGTVCVRRALPLSLTFDHRAVAGGEAARFVAAMVRDLASGE